ncbi:hypothetical protein RJT34_07565 [Clitoria ternatea]|uniref:TF-B3 domain-containing protein n=1 Tax=Clitoria ternatea TaxID=43366 RepID=A0AAN9K4K9_CLITE
MSNPVSLRLPNGTEWEVDCVERDGDVWFCKGWQEFVKYLSLDVSHFVVFKYEGNSSFRVIVFGKSAMEIEYPSNDKGTNDEEWEEVDNDKSLREKQGQYEIKVEKKKRKNNPANLGVSERDIKKRIMTFHQKVKQGFRSENDYFICTIQKSYIERDFLIIPKEFSTMHLQRKGNATLFVNEHRTWDVEFRCRSDGNLAFCCGWRKFLMDNKLKLGDVCAFELNKCNGVSFKVVIFPIEDDSSTPLFEGQEEVFHRPSSPLKRQTDVTSEANSSISKSDFKLYINRRLKTTIPFDYIKLNHIKNGRYATFQVGERLWRVKVLCYERYYFARFSQGWNEFIRDCDLKEGDACHLNMIDAENLVFQVSISKGKP